MCGIAGILNISLERVVNLPSALACMNKIQAHRGPDGEGVWTHRNRHAGFGHRRLSIIDLATGAQPMSDVTGNTICYNGEIYNYVELRDALLHDYEFRTTSDTEVILAAYKKWGLDCVNHLRGMFAFALWDDAREQLICARDRFGIKPFYYVVIEGIFYFASEAKALLPFLPELKINLEALKEYLVFQFYMDGKTLFENVTELLPAHRLVIKNGHLTAERYWEVYYDLDFDHTQKYFEEKLRCMLEDSVRMHVRSDVPVGAYCSGGLDSSIVASLGANVRNETEFKVFHGKFSYSRDYDESRFAKTLADMYDMTLHEVDITSADFMESIRKVIYHLDYPVAGPGSFPQYQVSKLAALTRKVVLGGQGGDEIFGGYVRYLIAYFEQCIKGAIEGTLNSGSFIVTYESIIPNLALLRNYKPLLKEFWREGLFENLDRRYFRLINRASTLGKEINWDEIGAYSPFETFANTFHGKNVGKESYLDKMTHFDFKTLLPALLQVEDRMSMAHGLESRVPFLDHPIVEFAATMPPNIKFKDGTLKMVLTNSMSREMPEIILNRKDKMGFPVPLSEWARGELKDFLFDIFLSSTFRERPYFNQEEILKSITTEAQFGRKIWGLLSLELWHQEFLDKHSSLKELISEGK